MPFSRKLAREGFECSHRSRCFRSSARRRCPPPRRRPSARRRAACSGVEMPKPDRQRQVRRSRASQSTNGANGLGKRRSLAGDAGARNQIDEAGGIFRHQLQPLRCGGGRGKEDGIEAGRAHRRHVGRGFFDAHIGQQAAVDAGGLRVARQRFQAVAQHRIQIGEQQQRNFGVFADLARDLQNLRGRSFPPSKRVPRRAGSRAHRRWDRRKERRARSDPRRRVPAPRPARAFARAWDRRR